MAELSDEDCEGEEAEFEIRTRAKRNRMKSGWSPEEDSQLRQLVSEMGSRNWSEIASFICGRKGKQCRERWVNHLSGDMKTDAWTTDEDSLLINMVGVHGTKWTKIAKCGGFRGAHVVGIRYFL